MKNHLKLTSQERLQSTIKVFLIFSMAVFMLSFVSSSLGTFKQGNCVDIKTILNASLANISSLSYPNSTTAITEQPMTKVGQTFNFTFCNTATLGTYNYDYNDEKGNVYVNDFDITPFGTEFTTGQGILYIVFVIAAIAIFIIVLMGAVKIPFKNTKDEEGKIVSINNLKYVKIFFMVMTYIIFMFIVGLLRGITANYIPEIGVHNLFNFIYWLMFSLMWPLVIIAFVFAVVFYLQDKKVKRYTNLNLK